MYQRFLVPIAAICLFSAVALADVAGTYTGKYEGSNGGGDISLTLTPSDGGHWDGKASFSMSGGEVKCKIISVKVDGDKVEVVYEFDLDGNALRSTIKGTLKGSTMEGTYETKAVADGSGVDSGTWKATSAK